MKRITEAVFGEKLRHATWPAHKYFIPHKFCADPEYVRGTNENKKWVIYKVEESFFEREWKRYKEIK